MDTSENKHLTGMIKQVKTDKEILALFRRNASPPGGGIVESERFIYLIKCKKRKLISTDLVSLLKEMRAFRNILIHEYAHVDNELVYEKAKRRLDDFELFKKAIVTALNNLR